MYTLFLSDLNETRSFWTDFRKTTQIRILVKIHSVEVELLHADGLTDRMVKLFVAFRRFGKTLKSFCFSQEN
jgi:hypothetical protein